MRRLGAKSKSVHRWVLSPLPLSAARQGSSQELKRTAVKVANKTALAEMARVEAEQERVFEPFTFQLALRARTGRTQVKAELERTNADTERMQQIVDSVGDQCKLQPT
jgi:hypothetical protein